MADNSSYRKGAAFLTERRHEEFGLIHKRTSIHGFGVGTGGFVTDLDDLMMDDETPFLLGKRSLILTPRDGQLLTACSLLQDISPEIFPRRVRLMVSAKLSL